MAVTSPELEALRGRAQLEVTLQARGEREPHRQSQQLNNLGVLTMGRYSTDSQEATQILARGVGAFQNAIEVDPNNLDALRNLEILLRRPEAATLPPNNPARAARRAVSPGRVASAAATDRGRPLPDPLGAVLAVTLVAPLAVLVLRERRARSVRASLGLAQRPLRSLVPLAAALAAVPCLLALAAMQPIVETTKTIDERTDAEVFVVADVSRSMLASSRSGSPTRLERVQAAAERAAGAAARASRRDPLAHRPAAAAPLSDGRRDGLSLDAREVDRDRAAAARALLLDPRRPS